MKYGPGYRSLKFNQIIKKKMEGEHDYGVTTYVGNLKACSFMNSIQESVGFEVVSHVAGKAYKLARNN
ncbi:hypothetical protein [Teredinibacter sp. KSP-S5-2]|uniref:hypothetical protein n=1 Tax=Teredinibacter sp. KSP-S5-2 TaxID=3034506 RepID=UPI002934B1A8|nr:hypothetical protein [Teredinibacter sp. KSP-S5-2]WNO08661.1 hypothetical protein P5V12_16950 [Teredinibacter sp. KSP-S5-2]